jgi:transposase
MTSVGRPTALDGQALAWLTAALQREPSDHGFESGLWRNRDVQSLIERQFNIYHSNGYVRDLVGKLGMSHRMRPAKQRTEKKRCAVNAEVLAWIAATLRYPPSAQNLRGERWTNATLRAAIQQRFGVQYSRGYVWEITTDLRLSHLLTKQRVR